MKKITDQDIKIICELLKNWESIPAKYKEALFWKEIEKKEYELKYSVKEKEEDIIANTYACPLQKVKTYNPNEIIDHKDFIREKDTKEKFSGWYNKLIFWDNLQVLKELLTNELLQKQIKENWWIKLIYIDPPFATKSDFTSWKWEKAYSDKIAWAEFIEFVRSRLILMRELLANNWSIYVHLDWKKSHYIKIIMDEIFWEHNFKNEIIWCYTWNSAPWQSQFSRKHDTIFYYTKTNKFTFNSNDVLMPYSEKTIANFKEWLTGSSYELSNEKSRDLKWKIPEDYWQMAIAARYPIDWFKRTWYPTEKPWPLIERIIKASSNEWDIILDAFAWSWTTLAVAEKLWRKWIWIDTWKLSIYTIQNRLMNIKDFDTKKPLKLKPFAVYNAWLYDFQILKNLDWNTYIWFTLSLFQCKQEKHSIDWIPFDWYLNLNHVQVFDYNHWRQWIVLDKWYLENIDEKIWNKLWKRVYIIVPATKIDWMLEDIVNINWREYFLLRVPYSIIKELYTKDFEKIKQPTSEDDVNNTVEAVWFDFIRVPKLKVEYKINWKKAEIKLLEFESKVISNKPLDYKNLETLSTVIIDYNYNWEYVNFEEVLFADVIKKNDYVISLDKEKLKNKCMIIYIDIFWNERKEIITIDNFIS